MNKFTSLGVPELLVKALSEMGIATPTEIQEKAIPILNTTEDDFIGLAQTGTGKTAAYALPLLNTINTSLNAVQAVILLPTRELSQQITDQIVLYSKYLSSVKIECVSGGTSIKPQIKAFKQAVHIIVATPGRLIDLVQKEAIDLSQVNYLILDEADEMMNLGFKDDLEKIIKRVPKNHSTWLFSATMSGEVMQVVNRFMKTPIKEVNINKEPKTQIKIDHQYLLVEPIEKFELLAHFLNENEKDRGIIFCRTKTSVQKLHKQLAANKFSSGALHGDLPQGLRDRVVDQFKLGQTRILVASDVAARGMDFQDIAYVIHYHLPEVSEVYTHRSGRTARAGKSGISLSFVFKEELPQLKLIESELNIKIHLRPKPEAQSVESNKAYLWAMRILKTKPDLSDKALRNKIGDVFKNLSKDELIDRLVTEQLTSNKPLLDPRLSNKPKVYKKPNSEKKKKV